MVIILALSGNAIKLIDWDARYTMSLGLPAQLQTPHRSPSALTWEHVESEVVRWSWVHARQGECPMRRMIVGATASMDDDIESPGAFQ